MKKFIGYFFIMSILLISCGDKQDKVIDKSILVSFNDEYILRKDIIKILPKNVSKEDSIAIVSTYIDNWLAERLFYIKALNTIDDSSEIKEKINNYRRQVYSHYYIENVLNNEVNYKVSEEEVMAYFNNHLDEYILPTTYIKAHYLTMDAKIYTYYDVLEKFLKTTLEDEEMLRDYSIGTTREVFFVNDWMELRQFLNIVGYKNQLTDYELSYTSYLDYINEDKRYLVKFDEFVLRGENAPIELVKNDIIQIIINNRKRDKYIQLKNNLIEDAVNSGVVILN